MTHSVQPRPTCQEVAGADTTATSCTVSADAARALPDWCGTSRYAIVRHIGSGASGAVYEVFDRQRQRTVALKTLLRYSPAALYQLKQEFRTLANVRHPNLMRFYELVADNPGQVFLTMELVRGQDFITYVRRHDRAGSVPPAAGQPMQSATVSGTHARRSSSGSPPNAPLLAVGPRARDKHCMADFGRLRLALRQLVQGLHALHTAEKVLHRDIKPANVLVSEDGRVVLLDFGVATGIASANTDDPLDGVGMAGTAAYMAPEQALGEPLT